MKTDPQINDSTPVRSLTKVATFPIVVMACLLGTPMHALSQSSSLQKPLPAPLFKDLGTVHYPITTRSDQAQRYFDQGLTLGYGFNHAEAIRSFRAAASIDPDCAMAHWGIAFALGPNINAPMADGAVVEAWQALQAALARIDHASDKERDLIRALEKRYVPEPLEDRSALDLAYADAMREVHHRYPQDGTIATLFAEASMDTMPWAYWTDDKRPQQRTDELLKALEGVFQQEPNHPGAHHLYIHAVEAGPTPDQGLPSARRLEGLVPGSGHLVHMPSHIYLRVGLYHDASRVNEAAIQIDQDYIAQCRQQGFYPGAYYPHNVQFLSYTAAMQGRRALSLKQAEKAAQFAMDNVCGPADVVEAPRFRHLPLLVQARFGQWDAVLKAKRPSKTYPFDIAMWHYARGLAHHAKKDTKSLTKEIQQYKALLEQLPPEVADSPAMPGSGMLQAAKYILLARAFELENEPALMIAAYKEGMKAQENLPYMEPPYWYYPISQSLGAALIRASRYAEAAEVFRQSLEAHPHNAWDLYGLHVAAKGQGHDDEAKRTWNQFQSAWQQAEAPIQLDWF